MSSSKLLVIFVALSIAIYGKQVCLFAQSSSVDALPTLGPSWDKIASPGSSLVVSDGELTFDAAEHKIAHVQRQASRDLITLTGKLSQWASIYLVWSSDSWCGVGQISPTPFGRIYSTSVVNGEGDEAIHRGIDFRTARWLRIQLGQNYVRFDYSNDKKQWATLRTIERPKDFSGAPRLIAVDKYYEAEDRPFSTSPASASRPISAASGTLKGKILELRMDAIPKEELRLSDAGLKAALAPKVDPVMALLEAEQRRSQLP
jgi:hypothetical protein